MNDKMAVTIAGLALSAIGGSFIVLYWSSEGRAIVGMARGILHVVLMAGVCVAGLGVYRAQPAIVAALGPSRTFSDGPTARISPRYRPAIWFALAQEIPILALTAMLLDGGWAFRAWSIAVIGHGIATVGIVLRRPTSPTRLDLALIRGGAWALAIGIGVVTTMIPI